MADRHSLYARSAASSGGAALSAPTSRSAARPQHAVMTAGRQLLGSVVSDHALALGEVSADAAAAAAAAKSPGAMGAQERLQHVRLGMTRIQNDLEVYRHVGELDTAAPGSDVSATSIAGCFALLKSELPTWLVKAPGSKKSSGPKMADARRRGVGKALERVDAALAAHPAPSGVEAPTMDGTLASGSKDIAYPGVARHLLQRIRASLADVSMLLAAGAQAAAGAKAPTDEDGEVVLSRKPAADAALTEAVAHYIDDFDELVATRIPAFLDEVEADRAVQSASLPEDADPRNGGADSADGSAPMVSVYIKDMVVAQQTVAHVVPAAENAKRHIDEIRSRLDSEAQALKTVTADRPERRTAAEHAELQSQLARVEVLHAAALEAADAVERQRAEWLEDEQRVLRDAVEGGDQPTLALSKRLKAKAAIDVLVDIVQRLNKVALPFASPMYCRRRQLTYGSFTMARVAIRLFDSATGGFTEVKSLCPATVRGDGRTAIADELLPASDAIWVPFEKLPEMVKGARCALRNASTAEMTECLEEQRDVGGYFVMNGGERISRALLMQRSNVPLNILRDRFSDAGPNFAPKAVVMRCQRRSHISTVNYFYYATTGEVVFSFARRIVWHIPVALLLFSCRTVSPVELFNILTVGVDNEDQRARIEAMLQHHRAKPYGDATDMVQYMAVIGRLFKQYQRAATVRFIPELSRTSEPHCDAWYGLHMLRRHLLPHLNATTIDEEGNVHAVPMPDAPRSGPAASTIDRAWPGEAIRQELDAKFAVLVEICRQLWDFVGDETGHQGNDSPAFQEVFATSSLLIAALETSLMSYNKVLCHRLANSLKRSHVRDLTQRRFDETLLLQLRGHIDRALPRSDALGTIHKCLTSGNFKVERDEDFFIPQNSGWVVMAEHLNFFRFFEQLRTLHRGKKISEMRSSEVRKFPAEAFGFLCMVHSPDGEDCGIVNFMSISMFISHRSDPAVRTRIMKVLSKHHTALVAADAPIAARAAAVPLWVDGRVEGYVACAQAETVADALRAMKTLPAGSQELRGSALAAVEVVYVPKGGQSPPGLFIFTGSCRMMRPVQDLRSGQQLNVGSWEHIWMNVAAVPSDLVDARRDLGLKYSHMEASGAHLISLTSNTIPFFEHNCSPRNLFQCGLSKQSSGTQIQGAAWRKEAKLFRTLTPQRYLVRTVQMDDYELDEFSLGVNAVVAVLAYSGYDMDDAVIVNHSSVERGFLHAMVTVAKVVDLTADPKTGVASAATGTTVFHNISSGDRVDGSLRDDGLPPRRRPHGLTTFHRDHTHPSILDDSAVYCTARRFTREDPERPGHFIYEYRKHDVKRWRSFDKGENGWVHNVVPLKYDGPDVVQAMIVFRIPRPPTVGDKFSSRHGQKGTLPLHVRSFDLPFTSRGMTPDVLINPHAFPSRMTVGMILEMVSGKLGAVQGRFMDHSAWSQVDERPVAAEEIGAALASVGFARYGRETLYCGNTGEPMAADVFTGLCGYQRLRHMVSDKWQARARTDHGHRAVTKTGQPVKGRKRHGGVRVGEMERDGLLSHGIADVVQDRLLHVSDKTKAYICTRCGGLVGIYENRTSRFNTLKQCHFCAAGTGAGAAAAAVGGATFEEGQPVVRDTVQLIDVPQVLRLWASELSGVGVRVAFQVTGQPE